MKITVYILTSNTVENGLESEVFTKEKDLKRAQIAIMTPGEDDDSEFATDITEMLKDGEIEEAWEYWEENVKSEKDTYLIDSQEIEVEVPVANAAAKTAKPVKKR